MRIAKNQILDRIFDICNQNSEDDDIITRTMYRYKCIVNESEEVQEAIYNNIADRMGYSIKLQCTKEQYELLEKEGY